MTEIKSTPQIPNWFWIVSVLAFIWNLLGIMAFIEQITLSPDALAAMTEPQQELYRNTPVWANAAFAIAVFGGSIGCLLLLLRKALAEIVFIISLVAIIVQMGHAFFISDSFAVFGPGRLIMPVMVIVVGILLVWFSKLAKNKGWL